MKKVMKVLVGALGIGAVSYLLYEGRNEIKALKVRRAIEDEDNKSAIAFKKFLIANSLKSNAFKYASCCAATPIYTFKTDEYVNGKHISPDNFVAPAGYVILKVSNAGGHTVYALADALDVDDNEAIFSEYHVCFYLDDEADWLELYSEMADISPFSSTDSFECDSDEDNSDKCGF